MNKKEKIVDEIITRYANCMEEIKKRITAINNILNQTHTTPFPITNIEFMCLQLRKISELIVMSSLVANKENYSQSKRGVKYKTDWNFNRIMDQIEKFNPDFYPKAINRKPSQIKKIQCEWENKEVILTKEKLKELYQHLSNIIHSQNPFNIKLYDLEEEKAKIKNYSDNIVQLLNEHQVVIDNLYILNCCMKNENTGKVRVTLFKKLSDEETFEKFNILPK
jgi:hypothetical protein